MGGEELVDVESGGADVEYSANDAKKDQVTSDANNLANNDTGAPANETSHFSDDNSSDAGNADARGGGDAGGE